MRKIKHHDNERQLMGTLPDAFVQELRDLVRTERDETMMSMPAERVMRAVKRSTFAKTEDMWLGELLSWFRPVFVAGLVVIVALVFYNVNLVSSENEYQQSAAERVLGLPSITVASAYDLTLEDHP